MPPQRVAKHVDVTHVPELWASDGRFEIGDEARMIEIEAEPIGAARVEQEAFAPDRVCCLQRQRHVAAVRAATQAVHDDQKIVARPVE